MPLTQQTTQDAYTALVFENPDRLWEIYDGRPREKPGMTASHNRNQRRLDRQLNAQLDDRDYEVCANSARLRAPSGAVFVPDVAVVPTAFVDAIAGRTDLLETYDQPVPFVAEVWSPSTGAYDVDTKFVEYRARGDREIWRVHPYDRTVTAWRRQADGSYAEETVTGGIVRPAHLPNVAIDVDEIFARL